MWDYVGDNRSLEVRNNKWFVKKVFNPTQKTNSSQRNQPISTNQYKQPNQTCGSLGVTPSVISPALRGESHFEIGVLLLHIHLSWLLILTKYKVLTHDMKKVLTITFVSYNQFTSFYISSMIPRQRVV